MDRQDYLDYQWYDNCVASTDRQYDHWHNRQWYEPEEEKWANHIAHHESYVCNRSSPYPEHSWHYSSFTEPSFTPNTSFQSHPKPSYARPPYEPSFDHASRISTLIEMKDLMRELRKMHSLIIKSGVRDQVLLAMQLESQMEQLERSIQNFSPFQMHESPTLKLSASTHFDMHDNQEFSIPFEHNDDDIFECINFEKALENDDMLDAPLHESMVDLVSVKEEPLHEFDNYDLVAFNLYQDDMHDFDDCNGNEKELELESLELHESVCDMVSPNDELIENQILVKDIDFLGVTAFHPRHKVVLFEFLPWYFGTGKCFALFVFKDRICDAFEHLLKGVRTFEKLAFPSPKYKENQLDGELKFRLKIP